MDGWFMLMHPQLVAGAWAGFNDPRITFGSDYWGQGGNNAAFVVGDFFRRALNERDLELRGARFPERPAPSDTEPTLLARVAHWFSEKADAASQWIAEGFSALFSDNDDAAPDVPLAQPERSLPADVDDEAVADSLTRMDRESRQLSRYIEEIRRQRSTQQ